MNTSKKSVGMNCMGQKGMKTLTAYGAHAAFVALYFVLTLKTLSLRKGNKPMLSCSCDYDWDPEPGMWAYCWGHARFEPFNASRRKRCCSCDELIDIGALCIKHPRYRYPYSEIEAAILGADPDMQEEPPIRISDHIQCERCGEIWLNLTAVGYECLSPNENMPKALKEYHELTGFTQRREHA